MNCTLENVAVRKPDPEQCEPVRFGRPFLGFPHCSCPELGTTFHFLRSAGQKPTKKRGRKGKKEQGTNIKTEKTTARRKQEKKGKSGEEIRLARIVSGYMFTYLEKEHIFDQDGDPHRNFCCCLISSDEIVKKSCGKSNLEASAEPGWYTCAAQTGGVNTSTHSHQIHAR